MRDRAKWDLRYMRVATNEVATWSKDPDKKVGCVIVSPDTRSVTMGFNGLPVGVADTPERLGDKETKNRLVAHAELNAILNARRDLSGWTLYVTSPPCTGCAIAIIQAGIARVVCPLIDIDSHWAVNQQMAKMILEEAGVRWQAYPQEMIDER